MSKPLIIGLTGGIGSGKSTVAKIFKSLEVPVFNSDLEAKKIINENSEVVNAISNEFGNVYVDGKLDTKEIAAQVFNDKTALQRLNDIVHPKVKEAFEEWKISNQHFKYLIKEAAILIEVGAYKELDKIILVTAPKAIRVERVIKRDGVSIQEVESRMKNQLSDEEKAKLVDFIICNDEKQLLLPQVLRFYQEISNLKT